MLLLSLVLIPLMGALMVKTINNEETEDKENGKNGIKMKQSLGLFFMIITFIQSLYLLLIYNPNTAQFQFQSYGLGIDGLSLILILLTALLMPITLILEPEMTIPLLLIEGLLMAVFMALDLLLFYLCFESVLIPLFFLIGWYKGRNRRLSAALSLFLYTLAGSLLMLISILIIYLETSTTNYLALLSVPFNIDRQLLLFIGFFIAFAVKVPMIPFHLWLPEAHVESPTGGSVLLAGILLKLGGYGLLRFVLPLFPYACYHYQPFIYLLGVIGIIYAGLTAIRQIDLKKTIAYSSVSHMNLALLGIFANNILAIEGAILLMVAHGLVSSALFLSVGSLYDRYHTRILKYYRGLASTMPLFALFFLFFILSNVAFPGSANFIGEFLVLAGLVDSNLFILCLASIGMILGAGYSIWLYNRIAFGASTPYLSHFNDLKKSEFFSLLILAIPTFIIGIKPNLLLELIHLVSFALLY
jgi:NADH-ubiquinone oxidoreductase chain 4